MTVNELDMQGGILKPHGRNFSLLIFFRLNGNTRKILEVITRKYFPSSIKCQKDESKTFRQNKTNTSIHKNIFLTEKVYRDLKVESKLTPRDVSFRKNARLSSITHLKEEGPSSWQKEFRKGFDILLLLASDSREHLTHCEQELKKLVERDGIELIHFEYGKVERNKSVKEVEHFGFRDGISNPVFDSNIKKEPLEVCASKVILARDPWGGYGSYLVYRKIVQFKDIFNGAIKELSTQTGLNLNRAEAMCMGRMKDGTPLIKSESGINKFNYLDDPSGVICPLHSHIRKANSRQSKDLPHRLIVRRGVPFYNDSSGNHGLHFLCFQQDIRRQFEFIQKEWLNSESKDIQADPIASTNKFNRYSQKWILSKELNSIKFKFPKVAEVAGSEYFFAPSISGLKNLISGEINDL